MPARRAPKACGSGSDWAFHASNAAVFDALVHGRHRDSLSEFFGAAGYELLAPLARAAHKVKPRKGPRVLVVPGMMGSRLSDLSAARSPRSHGRLLWIDPQSIAGGRLRDLALPSRRPIRARGVLLTSYAKLKLSLSLAGFDARFFAYDWRLGIDEIGASLAAAIAAAGRPTVLVAHSMGALAARVAIKRLPKRLLRRLIMLGAPNRGSFAPVLALRGTYPFVQKLSRLDLGHSPEELAAQGFSAPSRASIRCCPRTTTRVWDSTCSILRAGRARVRHRAPRCSHASRTRVPAWPAPMSEWCRWWA